MRCPECRFENREDARFCEECGAKLDLACPSCGWRAAAWPLIKVEFTKALALKSQIWRAGWFNWQ